MTTITIYVQMYVSPHMPVVHATIKHFILLYSRPSILFRAVNSRVLQCYDSKPTKEIYVIFYFKARYNFYYLILLLLHCDAVG